MMQKNTDKITLDLGDSEELADAIARLEPGDEFTFKGKASLDEDAGGVATCSIVEFNVVQSADESSKSKGKGKKSDEEAEETDEPTEDAAADTTTDSADNPPAVIMAKRRMAGDLGM